MTQRAPRPHFSFFSLRDMVSIRAAPRRYSTTEGRPGVSTGSTDRPPSTARRRPPVGLGRLDRRDHARPPDRDRPRSRQARSTGPPSTDGDRPWCRYAPLRGATRPPKNGPWVSTGSTDRPTLDRQTETPPGLDTRRSAALLDHRKTARGLDGLDRRDHPRPTETARVSIRAAPRRYSTTERPPRVSTGSTGGTRGRTQRPGRCRRGRRQRPGRRRR
jgi:hypothetical protein